MTFEERIQQFIIANHLLRQDGRYIVAVSGGADSIALLILLKQLGYAIEAAHCNFQLRGEESLRDETFVRSLCHEQDIRLHLAHFDTRTFAQLHKISIEMAARQLRYHYFEQLRNDIGATDICVAHHQDDSVETILMNLIRGTGIHGLTGIHPRQGHIVRPLLCVNRKEIEKWLQNKSQQYVTDSTNLIDDVWRNKLRLNVIPQLLDITPQACQNILSTAELLCETTQIADKAINEASIQLIKDNTLSIIELQKEPSPRSLLFTWLSSKGFSSAAITQIIQQLDVSKTGCVWTSASHELCIDRGRLILQARQPQRPSLRLIETGVYVYEPHTRIRLYIEKGKEISRNKLKASVDANKISFPLTIRPVEKGDRFVPFGMKTGSQLISDYLTDRKISVFEKRRQLVITNADGRIIWLVGQRPDERFRIDENTQDTLSISMEYEA